jgi:DNA repair protein RadC
MNRTLPINSDVWPREKLINYGAHSLNDEELLAVILGSGSKEKNVIELSRSILQVSNNSLSILARKDFHDLLLVKGVGPVKAMAILALFEISRRKGREQEKKVKITGSQDAYQQMKFLEDLVYEEFWVLYLNRSNHIISKKKISQGGVSGTVVDMKLIAKQAVSNLASGIILVHNHPSGNISPSKEDQRITQKVIGGLKLLDVSVLDHVIIAGKNYYSFADQGEL